VLDVGANEGQFMETARALLPEANLLLFEPNPETVIRLQRRASNLGPAKVIAIACGSRSAILPLHIAHFSPASSLLPATELQTRSFPETTEAKVVEVPVERLDELVVREQAPAPFLLKIDVQGAEMEVLRGAIGILPQVEVVVCEANTVEFYEKQARWEEIGGLLRQHGFRLADFGEPIRTSSNQEILYFDFAFVRASQSV
jgi:FkbM family methyltransferase